MRNILAILDIAQHLICIPYKNSYLKVSYFLQKLSSEIIRSQDKLHGPNPEVA